MNTTGENVVKGSIFKNQTFQKYFFICVLLFFPVLNWALFWLAVNVQTIGLAFTHYNKPGFTFVHFEAFWESLTTGGDVGMAMKNTFIYFAGNLFVTLPLAMVMAFFLYKQIFGNRTFMIIFYLPAVMSSVAMVTIYMNIWDFKGPIAQVLGSSNFIPEHSLFTDARYSTWFILLYNVWTGFGTDILLFIGAMSRIPLEVFEAAKLEGCKPGRELISIIVPLIWPTFSTMLILSFTGLFSATGPILLFTAGGDAFQYGTMTVDYWIFNKLYGGGARAGGPNEVSATGLAFTCVAVPLVLFVRWLAEKVPNNEY